MWTVNNNVIINSLSYLAVGGDHANRKLTG